MALNILVTIGIGNGVSCFRLHDFTYTDMVLLSIHVGLLSLKNIGQF